ncbi:MAG: hypothetical protein HUJ54_07500 [Erysipelotrichaceae bacterium]|nr:hypothetical protein [Erysipelotrichaceae bacterium]
MKKNNTIIKKTAVAAIAVAAALTAAIPVLADQIQPEALPAPRTETVVSAAADNSGQSEQEVMSAPEMAKAVMQKASRNRFHNVTGMIEGRNESVMGYANLAGKIIGSYVHDNVEQ